MHTLSIIMPVYNEIGTIAQIVDLVGLALPRVGKELIIVDDCSSDGTREWLVKRFGSDAGGRANGSDNCSVKLVLHERNKGKGGAIQTGFKAATGDVLVIQDADLEYDPADWEKMYELITVRKVADVVYGSRFFGAPHRSLFYHHYIGNRLISRIYNVLYDQTLNDIEVCYKMFTREVLDSLALTCNDFGIEIQLSAQIAMARKWRIYEIGIQYYGRTYDEGKKINWRDGIRALWYLIKFRFC